MLLTGTTSWGNSTRFHSNRGDSDEERSSTKASIWYLSLSYLLHLWQLTHLDCLAYDFCLAWSVLKGKDASSELYKDLYVSHRGLSHRAWLGERFKGTKRIREGHDVEKGVTKWSCCHCHGINLCIFSGSEIKLSNWNTDYFLKLQSVTFCFWLKRVQNQYLSKYITSQC